MHDFFTTIQFIVGCLTLIAIAFAGLLALPQSKLRSCCLEAMKYLMAMLLGLMVICPIDVIPDVIPVLGWSDDIAYVFAAFTAVSSARKDRLQRKYLA